MSMERDRDLERIGRYRIERRLGSGGMGTVFLGWDELLERRVAIKALHAHVALGGDARTRFLREARVLSRLDHPGICTIYDLVEHDGNDYLILELIDGVPLGRAIKSGTLTDGERLEVAVAITEALAAAHDAGVIHRDLKPDNVMLRQGGGVAILDFGLARPVGAVGATEKASVRSAVPADVTQDGAVVGTPGYISPEQVMGAPASRASDVYALGLVLQELFTGEPAYDRRMTVLELLTAARDGATRPCEVPDARLRSLITAMTAKDPEARPATREALDTLRSLLRAPERRRQRRKMALVAGGLATLSLLAGIAFRRTVLPPPVLEPGARAVVAVLPFSEASGSAGIGIGLAEMIARTLGSHERLHAVPMKRVLRVTGDDGRAAPEARWPGIGRRLGARIVVGGEVLWRDGRPELRVEVLDREGGVQRFRVRADTFPDALSLACGQLARRLVPGGTVEDPRGRFSADRLAALAFAAGEQRRYTVGPSVAIHYFRVCLDRDPSFWQAVAAELTCMDSLGQWTEGEAKAQALLAKARETEDRHLEMAALGPLGMFEVRLGKVEAARRTWSSGLELARTLGSATYEVAFLNRLGTLHQKLGERSEARRCYGEAAKLALQLGDRNEVANSEVNMGSLCRAGGDFEAARRHLGRALAIYRELDSLEDIGLVEYNLGAVCLMEGRTVDATTHFRAALDAQERAGNVRLAAEAREGLAILEWSRGDLGEAEANLRRALEAYRRLDHPEGIARAQGNLALVLRDRGRLSEAETFARGCLDTVGPLHHGPIETNCAAILAQALALRGRPAEAAQALDRPGIDREEVSVLAADGLIRYARGDRAGAARLLRRAAAESGGRDRELFGRWAEAIAAGRPPAVSTDAAPADRVP